MPGFNFDDIGKALFFGSGSRSPLAILR